MAQEKRAPRPRRQRDAKPTIEELTDPRRALAKSQIYVTRSQVKIGPNDTLYDGRGREHFAIYAASTRQTKHSPPVIEPPPESALSSVPASVLAELTGAQRELLAHFEEIIRQHGVDRVLELLNEKASETSETSSED